MAARSGFPPTLRSPDILVVDLGYRQAPAVSKVFSIQEPFPVTIDVTALPDGPERDVD